jgi:hypothetical protein
MRAFGAKTGSHQKWAPNHQTDENLTLDCRAIAEGAAAEIRNQMILYIVNLTQIWCVFKPKV